MMKMTKMVERISVNYEHDEGTKDTSTKTTDIKTKTMKKQKHCQFEAGTTAQQNASKTQSERKPATKVHPTRNQRASMNHPKSSTTTGRAKKATRKREVVRRKSCEADWRVVDVGGGWSRVK
jgi:hypothetical protein